MPESSFPARSTPFPSHLLDTIMPVLKDTEWRVLCVVVRATLGWVEGTGGQRKPQDWLTQSQMKERTGRATEAISHAIDALARQGLIEVRDETGRVLSTPQERRRCQGHLLFRLCPQTLEAPHLSIADSNSENGERLSAPEVNRKDDCSVSEQGYSETELRKSNTTKERINKIKLPGIEPHTTGGDKAVDKSIFTTQSRWKRADGNPAISDVQQFLEAYSRMFALRSARGEPPPICWEKDSKLVKELLAQYGYKRLIELLEHFFQINDPWVRKRGYALFCFPTLLPQLLMVNKKDSRRSMHVSPLLRHMEPGQHWQKAAEIAVSSVSLFERYPDLAQEVRGQSP